MHPRNPYFISVCQRKQTLKINTLAVFTVINNFLFDGDQEKNDQIPDPDEALKEDVKF